MTKTEYMKLYMREYRKKQKEILQDKTREYMKLYMREYNKTRPK